MNFETLLENCHIPFEKHTHRRTLTAQGLAAAEGVSGYMVAKPVVVKGDSGYAMCVVPAPRHVDLKRLADLLHDPSLRLARESEMRELFPACEVGAEPPVGCLFGLKTIMDTQLRQDAYLVMQSGRHTESIRIRRQDFERICNPRVAPIACDRPFQNRTSDDRFRPDVPRSSGRFE
jgi:Ala-tRNA(Pro) deacylase